MRYEYDDMLGKWYEQLFTNYALKYDQESFISGTLGECDFLEKELNFNKNLKILDVGCGTGRHSIELAKRGYNVVGIDLSESMLNRAKEKALAENLTVTFQQYDARNLPFENEFDLAIILCEGAFDAIAIRRNAIPLFGKSIQSELEKKIIGNSVKKLYICLDSDAIKNAIGLAKKFMSYGIQTHLVALDNRDASELGYEQINKKI
jgi:SAM-dependent methyltransferase